MIPVSGDAAGALTLLLAFFHFGGRSSRRDILNKRWRSPPSKGPASSQTAGPSLLDSFRSTPWPPSARRSCCHSWPTAAVAGIHLLLPWSSCSCRWMLGGPGPALSRHAGPWREDHAAPASLPEFISGRCIYADTAPPPGSLPGPATRQEFDLGARLALLEAGQAGSPKVSSLDSSRFPWPPPP